MKRLFDIPVLKALTGRKSVFVLHGHWNMPCEDCGVNIWDVAETMEGLQERMWNIGQEMIEEASKQYDMNFITDIAARHYEAEDCEGHYVRIYITEHKIKKHGGNKHDNYRVY